ncbi:hypothetical protein BH10PLA2_BH10PLA2_15230 [soil metagenome]
MRIAVSKPLFAWDCLDDSPTLSSIRQFLEAIPDADLLEGLRRHRAKGRDDYPVHVLWGVLLLSIFLRHPSIESCLAELRRNEPLRLLLNIAHEERVPKPWNMSRFLDLLGQDPHLSRLPHISRVISRGSRPPALASRSLDYRRAATHTAIHA